VRATLAQYRTVRLTFSVDVYDVIVALAEDTRRGARWLAEKRTSVSEAVGEYTLEDTRHTIPLCIN